MSSFKDWSLGAKLLTGSVVCMLLAIGLCATGTPFMGHGTSASDFLSGAGLVALLVAGTLFLSAIVAFVAARFKDDGQ